MELIELIEKYGETQYKHGYYVGEPSLEQKLRKKAVKLFNRIVSRLDAGVKPAKEILNLRQELIDMREYILAPQWHTKVGQMIEKLDKIVSPLDAEVSDDFCIWKYDEDDDTYFTKCDNGFQVMNGSLEDNHFSYCVYCGKKVKTKKLSKNSR